MVSFVGALEVLAILVYFAPTAVLGHGRLWDPPGRSTMWRQGFQTPVNYQDNELNCGGLSHEISQGYKCGLCGDPYDGERKNEEGGVFATGLISRTYQQGQVVAVKVDLTANHKGYFEFKLCPKSSSGQRTTEVCLDQYTLALADGTGTQYKLNSDESRMYEALVVLPVGVTCDYCVIQWRYHGGNNWGQDPDGKQCIGCGYQEEFYGCADVRIEPRGSGTNNSAVNPTYQASTPQTSRAPTSSRAPAARTQPQVSTTTTSNSNRTADCQGVSGRQDLNDWCKNNCVRGFCPSTHCQCNSSGPSAPGKKCRALGVFATIPGMDTWCVANCAGGYCPSTHCTCS